MKIIYSIVICIAFAFVNGGSMTVILEDFSEPCEIFVNGNSIGEVKDSFLFSDIPEGSYKISMFSENVFKEVDDSLLAESDRKAKKLGNEKMKETVLLGTETVFLSKSEAKKITIKNKQVNEKMTVKGKSNNLCCCLGGGTGCCLGILAVSTLMVWLNNQYTP